MITFYQHKQRISRCVSDVGIRAVGLMVQLILLYVLGKSVLSKNNNILVL